MAHCQRMTNETWLVRYELDGVWHTAKTDSGKEMKASGRSGFKRACKLASELGRDMKWAHMTAVVEERWAHYAGEHRTAENNFTA